MGILSAILWTPAIGAFLLALIPDRDQEFTRSLGKLFSGITVLLTCYLLFTYNQRDAGLQFSEYFAINPKVGMEMSHESAPLHVTGTALYTEDLVNRTKDVLHAWPLQAAHAHANGPAAPW